MCLARNRTDFVLRHDELPVQILENTVEYSSSSWVNQPYLLVKDLFLISKIERIEKGKRGEGRIKLIGSNSNLEISRFKQRCLENVDVLFFFKIKTCLHAHLLGKSWTFFRL